MIGSLNKTLLALFLSAGAAYAAPAVPHPTAPALDENAMDSDGAPDTQGATQYQGDTPMDVAAAPKSTISETSVNTPPIEGFGTLDASNGGLSDDIWRGGSRDAADALLKEMRTGIGNAALQMLTTHLLMTQAAPPQGSSQDSWFTLRANALIAIGQDDKAQAMIASLPASMTDASLVQLQTELMLIRGEYDHACEKAQPDALPADDGPDAFWHKLSILCKARAGKQDEAMVGIDLMREERHTDDVFFQESIRRIGDKTSLIRANPKQWTPLNITLLRLANDPEKLKGSMDAFPPVTLKYLAQDTSLDTKLREKALLRAQQLGILPPGEGNRVPEQPFARPLASDVTTLVTALGSGKPPNDSDNAVIARLALDDAGISDSRRIQRLLTLMEPFGYHVPPDVWQKLFAHRERFDGEVPPAPLVARLGEAAANGRRGEVILLAALIGGGNDVDKVPDLALLPVVKALIAAGFEKEARSVAHDAVKAYSAR